MTDALSFLQSVAGFTRSATGTSADRPVRFGTIDPDYDPFTTYPSAPAPARVLFDGETTPSGKAYAYAAGMIPWPGMRVYLIPAGNTYLIGGAIGVQLAQGFWSNADGTEAGVELGGGTFYDTTEGMVITNDLSVSGDLSVQGIGREISKVKEANLGRGGTSASADPDLVMNLTAGTWRVEFDLLAAALDGDIKIAWEITGTTSTFTQRMCWGPSPFLIDSTTPDEGQGREAVPMRVGAYTYASEVEYGLSTAVSFAGIWERGLVRLTTPGTVALRWAQATSDLPTPSVIGQGSIMTARRIA